MSRTRTEKGVYEKENQGAGGTHVRTTPLEYGDSSPLFGSRPNHPASSGLRQETNSAWFGHLTSKARAFSLIGET
jgi:hypothetical protein